MARNKNDRLSLVQMTSFEVKRVDGDWAEVTGRWHKLADECRGLANFFWQGWVNWHYQRDSYRLLKEWLEKRSTEGIKAAGKCPVDAMPKELSNHLYHESSKRFPALNKRLQVLLLNRLTQTLTSRKAASGSLPGHSAILLHHESHPTFTKPYPILFDKDNAPAKIAFEPPAERGGNWKLRLRLWRDEIDGKGSSPVDVIELWCKGKKVQSQVRILERIASGEYAFKGSQLIYSRSSRKWFARLCYERPKPEKLPLDPEKVAVLSAAEDHPWDMLLPDGATLRPGGHGRYIAPVRRQLLKQRWDRRANYRNAGSANKGHGRERAGAGPQWKLQQRWKDFVKHVNRGIAREVVDRCVAAGIGLIEYRQPDGEWGTTRFLHNAGKVEGRNDSTGWDWYQLGTLIHQASEKVGIEVRVAKQSCEGSGGDENPGTSRNDRSGGVAGSCAKLSKGRKPNASGNGQAKRDRSKKGSQSQSGKGVAR